VGKPIDARHVRFAGAGESIVDALERLEIPETNKMILSEEKIEALAEIICRTGYEPESKSAALLVLMGAIKQSISWASLDGRKLQVGQM
jgi:hypothetical protein